MLPAPDVSVCLTVCICVRGVSPASLRMTDGALNGADVATAKATG